MKANTKISIKKDGSQWCILWGIDIQEGVAAFGDTIEEAMEVFAWRIMADLKQPNNIITNRPKIVCLCGSTKFKDAYEKANFEETIKGNIVLTVGCFMHADNVEITKEQKSNLDSLHLMKINIADEILVLNVGGYIGESTRNEIEYACRKGIEVRFLEKFNE